MKKILAGVGFVFTILFLVLLINYVKNENLIDDYNNEIYSENNMSYLGFLQPYIAHYNQGNMEYINGNYDKAVEVYKKALESSPSFERECLTRINLALSMIAPIVPEEITEENIEETIKILEDAKAVLMEHGCANENDSDGHNEDAQHLKEDIDKFLEQLKEQNQSGNNGNGGDDDNPQENGGDDDNSGDDEKEKELEEQQRRAEQSRSGAMQEQEDYRENGYEYNYSDFEGKKW